MTSSIILQSIDEDGLKSLIKEAVRDELAAIPPKKENNYLTRAEMAAKLKVSLPTIDKMIGMGKLRAVRLGGRILFKEDDLNLDEIPVNKHRR